MALHQDMKSAARLFISAIIIKFLNYEAHRHLRYAVLGRLYLLYSILFVFALASSLFC